MSPSGRWLLASCRKCAPVLSEIECEISRDTPDAFACAGHADPASRFTSPGILRTHTGRLLRTRLARCRNRLVFSYRKRVSDIAMLCDQCVTRSISSREIFVRVGIRIKIGPIYSDDVFSKKEAGTNPCGERSGNIARYPTGVAGMIHHRGTTD